MKMLNIRDGSKITCKPPPLPSNLDPALEAAASEAGPQGLQDLWSCVQGTSCGEAVPWLMASGGRYFTFSVPHPEAVGPWSSSHLWLPLVGGPRYRGRGGGTVRKLQELRGTFKQVAQFSEHQNVKVPSCNLGAGLHLALTRTVLHRPFSGLRLLTCNRRKLGSLSPGGCMSSMAR